MNILFMSLIDFESIEQRNIYTDLLRELRNDGHMLYIISPMERRKRRKTELYRTDGCVILKQRIGNIQKTNYLEKGISTLLLERQMIWGIRKYFSDVHFDLILYATPPITFQKVIEYVKKRDHAMTYLMLKDIWPQGLVDLGVIRKTGITGILYRMFRKKEQNLYRISDFIGCMSEANIQYLIKYNSGITTQCVELCPNAIEPELLREGYYKNESVLDKYDIPRDKVLFIYGGNLGKPQGIGFLLQVMEACKNDEAFFVIVGNGTEYEKTEQYIKGHQLKNVRLLQMLPKEEYEEVLASCDVGMLFLDVRFTIPNYPSRILSYMDKAKPVLAATDSSSDIGYTIEEGKFGYWCKSGDISGMLKHIDQLCNKELRVDMGRNARSYLEQHFTADKVAKIIEKHFVE